MKYRIAKKKIKRDVQLMLWIESALGWWRAKMGFSSNITSELNYASVILCLKMLAFDYANMYMIARKHGLKCKHVSRFRTEQKKKEGIE